MTLRSSLSSLLIIGGLILFTWNALGFYTGYSAPSELSITTFNNLERHYTPIERRSPEKKATFLHGERIGEISIPTLNKSYPFYEGTSPAVLRKGAGHVEGTVLPGEKNNSVISGHRDTIFRGLKDLAPEDRIIVTTDEGQFHYEVKKIRIVKANDRTALTPKPRATLTLTTCYPFYYIGNAPKRYVVVAELISNKIKNTTPGH